MSIELNIQMIQQQIASSLTQAKNPAEKVTLVAVSKKQSSDKIRQAYAAGIRDFGENYWQEAASKMQELKDLSIIWHMIGDIQSNKAKVIAENFDWVHTVCRQKIAEKLNHYCNKDFLNICIEVNINNESSKSGIIPREVNEFAQQLRQYPKLKLRGLMCIPEKNNPDAFATMAMLFQTLNQQGFDLDTLSMGMSGDFQQAIVNGATMIRVGTALFGAR